MLIKRPAVLSLLQSKSIKKYWSVFWWWGKYMYISLWRTIFKTSYKLLLVQSVLICIKKTKIFFWDFCFILTHHSVDFYCMQATRFSSCLWHTLYMPIKIYHQFIEILYKYINCLLKTNHLLTRYSSLKCIILWEFIFSKRITYCVK